jgi:hypothetical protein
MEVNDISLLGKQLTIKKSEYLQAIQKGAIHCELKIIHLEIKELEQKLKIFRNSISEIKG